MADLTDLSIIFAAQKGERRRLIELVRSSKPMSQDIRSFVADLLEGKRFRGRGRPKTRFLMREQLIAEYVYIEMRKGKTLELACEKIGEDLGMSDSAVRACYTKHHKFIKKYLPNSDT